MLKGVISKANLILSDAQQRLTVQSAEAIESVCIGIENLNKFINKEIDKIKKDPKISDPGKFNATRGVLEQAGRKLEVLKDRSNYSILIHDSDDKLPEAY